MIVRRVSPLTGDLNEMDLDVTGDQLQAWADGLVAQDAFPGLSAEQREFIISGLTPEDWGRMMGCADCEE